MREEIGENNKDIFQVISGKDFRLKIFFEGIVVGIGVGLVISAFRYLLDKAEELRTISYIYTQNLGSFGHVARFIILVLLAGIISIIIKKAPQTAGSGMIQIKGFFLGQVKMKWVRNLIGKFLGAIIAIGAGLSLGKQGPAVQIGASIGQGISRLLGRLRMEEKYLVSCGAGAGLAAAFNAPLAGVVFALEEVHKSFSPAALISTMGAALSADFVMRQFFGAKPVMDFSGIPVLPQQFYLYLIGLGLFCGVIGVLFNKFLVFSYRLYMGLKSRLPFITSNWHPLGAFLIAGLLGYHLPQALGGGENLITSLAQMDYALQFLVLLLFVKFTFTMISAASGAPGGIFLPMLVIGALTGNIYGKLTVRLFENDSLFIPVFIVFAMAALFTAVVKAPVTGSILITEMTGSFEHLLPVIIVCMISYLLSDLLKTRSIYEELYQLTISSQRVPTESDRSMISDTENIDGDDKEDLTSIERRQKDSGECSLKIGEELSRNTYSHTNDAKTSKNLSKTIIEEVVCNNSYLEGQRVKNINWPEGCLIVSIRRGEDDIIPRGNTRICAGDFLYLLVDQGKEGMLKTYLMQLCNESPDLTKRKLPE